MQEFEKYVRTQRLKGNYMLCIFLGEKFLKFIPDSNIIKEDMAISFYWLTKNGPCPSNMTCTEIETSRLDEIKNIKTSIGLINQILESKPQDKDLLVRSLFNHQFFIEKLEDLTSDIIRYQKPHVYPAISKLPLITFSITTCRRLHLFKATMKAFIENFKDINLIHRWICIDDNSSVEDREEMKKDWPFFEFIWKTPEQKGHPKSMQILTSMITTPYLIHIEDDRLLLDRRHYVKEMIDILESDAALGQVVFNKNYKETARENICGGVEKTTPRRTLYYEHEHCITDEEITNFNKRHNNITALNCYYYPHFSLAPSMIKTDIFKTLKFEDELCFEYKFAQSYVSSGFKTAFLPGYYFKHIGRLTSDKHSLTCNAYDLLTTPQFFDIPKYKSFVINLAKRTDRLNRLKRYSSFLPPDTAVMPACDGYMLICTPRLYSLCEKCDYQMRPGVIGCALSHLVLYHKLLFDEDVDGYLIFEDDVTPGKAFMSKLHRVLIVLKNRNAVADLIFFTTVLKNENHKFREEGVIRKRDRQDINVDSIGGTGCYYISKNAAMVVFDYIENNTLDVAIDALLFNISHLVATYFVQPCIISQRDVSCVSNVQHDHDIVSPLLLENPTLDKKVVYNNEISTNDKKSKIDLFDNIYMRQSHGLGVNMSMPMKSLSEIYKDFPVLLSRSENPDNP